MYLHKQRNNKALCAIHIITINTYTLKANLFIAWICSQEIYIYTNVSCLLLRARKGLKYFEMFIFQWITYNTEKYKKYRILFKRKTTRYQRDFQVLNVRARVARVD